MLQKVDDVQGATKVFDSEQFKTAILVIPVLGTLCAITFDVGYFSGIGINYYSVFSPAEHIGFALQVAPMAFLTTLFSLIVMLPLYPTSHNTHHTTSKTDRFQTRTILLIINIILALFGLGAWWILHITMGLLATIVLAFHFLRSLIQHRLSSLSMHQRRMYSFSSFG